MTLLRKMRRHVGITQQAMADLIGLTLRGYQDIEAGRAKERSIHLNAARWAMLIKYHIYFDEHGIARSAFMKVY